MAKEPKPKKEKSKKKSGRKEDPILDNPTVKGALSRLGLRAPTSATAIITATATANVEAEQVWNVWKEIEKWGTWGKPIFESGKWTSDRHEWTPGAKFEYKVNWGFPFGSKIAKEVVKEVVPGMSASWWKSFHEVKSCRLWFFEPSANGKTTFTVTEVMWGFVVFWAKLFGARKRWEKQFKMAVDALAKAAERAEASTPTGTTPTGVSS